MHLYTNRYTDYLSHARVQPLEDPMFMLIDAQQKADSPQQAYAALAMLFYIQSEALGLNISDTLGYIGNSISHMKNTDTQKMRALSMYIRKEMEPDA